MTGRRPVIVVFCTQWEGHLRRLLPIVRGLVGGGFEVHVFGHGHSRRHVELVGGRLFDLFGKYPLDAVDTESVPNSSRHVTHAGAYARDVIDEVRPLQPVLIVYDTFSVIARAVATALGVPAVNVCAGHNLEPARTILDAHRDLDVRASAGCHAAAERLRSEFGLLDASPFCYVTGISRSLNVYCEPPQFLSAAEQRAFAPIAFFGSLPSIEHVEHRRHMVEPAYFRGGPAVLKVYASFGTVIWRYYRPQAMAVLAALADAATSRRDTELVISLGGTEFALAKGTGLERDNVVVHERVDQWAMLEQADAFVTHHGLNSTHEGIFMGVPMLSYPFFWDQPSLAARCAELGLALRLVPSLRGPLDPGAARSALHGIHEQAAAMRQRLAEAREWEMAVMAGRPAVIRQIIDLA